MSPDGGSSLLDSEGYQSVFNLYKLENKETPHTINKTNVFGRYSPCTIIKCSIHESFSLRDPSFTIKIGLFVFCFVLQCENLSVLLTRSFDLVSFFLRIKPQVYRYSFCDFSRVRGLTYLVSSISCKTSTTGFPVNFPKTFHLSRIFQKQKLLKRPFSINK